MNRVQQARDVFGEVVDLPPADREAALERLVGRDRTLADEVRRLLRETAKAEEDGFLGSSVLGSGIVLGGGADEETAPLIRGYELLGVLGSGSNGTVYRARSEAPLARRMAVKVLRSGLSETARARFLREQHLLAQINHPSVAQVYDAGTTEDGRPFVAVELVNGRPITTYTKGDQLTVRQRLDLLVSVCEAVHHIHSQGILHRDLKPENILVANLAGTLVPKVIDFGASSVLDNDKSMETIGPHIVGTVAYMAPELLGSGRQSDVQADVFALGVIAHELLSGTHPFGGRTEPLGSVVRSIQDDALPRLGGSVPNRRALDAVLATACDKNQNRRYPSAQHLADEFRRVVAGHPVEASSPTAWSHLVSAARCHPVVSLGVLAFGCVVIALSIGLLLVSRDNARQVREMRSTVTELVDGVLDEISELSGAHEAREHLARLVLERLESVTPQHRDAQYHMQRARALSELSAVQLDRGEVDEAIRIRRTAVSEFESFFGDRPPTRAAQDEHVRLVILLGDAYALASRNDEVLAAYRTAHRTILRHHDASREDIGWQDELCWSYERLTPYLLDTDLAEALDVCQARLSLATELHEISPDYPADVFRLGCAESWLGKVLLHCGDDEQSLAMNQRAARTLRQSYEAEPDRFAYRSRWIIARMRVAESLVAMRSPSATEYIEDARIEAEHFMASNPDSSRAMRHLARILVLGIIASPELVAPERADQYRSMLKSMGYDPPSPDMRPPWMARR